MEERRVEFHAISNDLLSQWREENAVVDVQAYEQHTCGPEVGLASALVAARTSIPNKKHVEDRTAACLKPISEVCTRPATQKSGGWKERVRWQSLRHRLGSRAINLGKEHKR